MLDGWQVTYTVPFLVSNPVWETLKKISLDLAAPALIIPGFCMFNYFLLWARNSDLLKKNISAKSTCFTS